MIEILLFILDFLHHAVMGALLVALLITVVVLVIGTMAEFKPEWFRCDDCGALHNIHDEHRCDR